MLNRLASVKLYLNLYLHESIIIMALYLSAVTLGSNPIVYQLLHSYLNIRWLEWKTHVLCTEKITLFQSIL